VSSHHVRATRATVAFGAAVLMLASCSSGTTSTGSTGGGKAAALPKTLVFSPLSLAPPALKSLSVGVKGYAGSKGWDVIVQDPNFDASKQTQDLNEVLSSGRAGAGWIIAVTPKSLAPIITTAQSKGIPLLVNGRPDEYGYSGAQPGITFDYVDYAAGGKALGEQLGNCVNEKMGGQAQVLAAQSTVGQAGKKEFEDAAAAALKATAPGATIVQSIIAKDRAGSQTDIGNVLQGKPTLAAVMASNDEGALGALGAFAAAGKTPKCVADFGGNDEVLKDVAGGTIYASVALQFQADMTQSFDTLVTMQANPKANGQVLTVPQKVITAKG
jgi:ABC-type sugar transport system substrate-binding protein